MFTRECEFSAYIGTHGSPSLNIPITDCSHFYCIKMKKRFFEPYIGPKYHEGIRGKRILVFGASFYCNKKSCPYFSDCTNPQNKDSSRFDQICPEYMDKNMKLSNEPSYAIDNCYRAYLNFGAFMQNYVGDKHEYIWERMAFTNYLQFFSPTVLTKPEYLSERDFEAFVELIQQLQPNIVFIWGLPVTEEVRDKKEHMEFLHITDYDKLPETEYYVCHMNVPDVPHEILLVCTYHPSSVSYWYGDLEKLNKYFDNVINQ